MVDDLEPPVKILDVGGTEKFWATMGYGGSEDIDLVLLNLTPERGGRWRSITGDARDLSRFGDDHFDLVFSNSVIEHLATFESQVAMAREIRRVGRGFFVQTPNRFFPIEPHFMVPLFQFLPRSLRIFLLQRFELGWVGRQADRRSAEREVDDIRLLSRREMGQLFPGAKIWCERFLGLTKSFVAIQHPGERDSRPSGGPG